MDILAWVLTVVAVALTATLTIKTGGVLWRYRKVKDKVVRVGGAVVDWFGLESVKRNGNRLSTFYPVYECVIGGKEHRLNGVVRRVGNPYDLRDVKVVLLHDKETGELWCEEDLPLIAKQLKVRLVTVGLLLVMMIVTSVIL